MTSKKPKAIIGIGNYLMGDEGIGIHALKYLEETKWPPDVELIDAGIPGPSLIYILENREKSLIIDCADFRGKPGEVLVIEQSRLKREDPDLISLHGTSVLGTLALADTMQSDIGEVYIIGVQPKEIEFGNDLSPEVEKSLPKIKKQVMKLIEGDPFRHR